MKIHLLNISRQKLLVLVFCLISVFSGTTVFAALTLNATTLTSNGVLNLTSASNVVLTGNVGIGTTTPEAPNLLHLYAPGGDTEMMLDSTALAGGTTMLTFRSLIAPADIQNWNISINGLNDVNTGNIDFDDLTAGTTPFTIQRVTGNVGIGTTTPAANLDVVDPLAPESRFALSTTGADTEFYIQNRDGTAGIHIQPYGVGPGRDNFWIGSDADNTLRFRDDTAGIIPLTIQGVTGNVGIGTTTPNATLEINSNSFILNTAQTPASSSATCITGMHAWDANFVYICVATNTWKRASIATW